MQVDVTDALGGQAERSETADIRTNSALTRQSSPNEGRHGNRHVWQRLWESESDELQACRQQWHANIESEDGNNSEWLHEDASKSGPKFNVPQTKDTPQLFLFPALRLANLKPTQTPDHHAYRPSKQFNISPGRHLGCDGVPWVIYWVIWERHQNKLPAPQNLLEDDVGQGGWWDGWGGTNLSIQGKKKFQRVETGLKSSKSCRNIC